MALTREIPNQLTSGRDISERQLYLWMIDYLGKAEDAARGLAHARKDARWLHVSSLMAQIRANATKLMNRSQILIVPGTRFN